MKTLLAPAIAIVVLASPASAKFMMPRALPVDRLLQNAEKHLAAHPESNEAKYIVARIHYLAFARNSTNIPAFNEADAEGKPSLAPNWMLGMNPRGEPGDKLSDAQAATHASAALKGFTDLTTKEPGNALYQLGLASLIEQIIQWKDRAKPADLPAGFKDLDLKQARDAYLKAHQISLAEDSKATHQPIAGWRSLVSFEAGEAFIRLAGDDTSQAKTVAEVKESIEKIKGLPRGAITPMIFSMRPARGIDGLLDPACVVDFDLRGYGPREQTTWLQPTTALLVWDPAKQAAITSGQQLFGGYTFQIFRNNGFEALAALDDNADGTLSGKELTGIRAWFDANQDGQSSASEVRDLADLGIAGIATQTTTRDGRHPANPNGIILESGDTLPTFDWTTDPVR